MKKTTFFLLLLFVLISHVQAADNLRFLVGGVQIPQEEISVSEPLQLSLQKAFSRHHRVRLISAQEIAKWKAENASSNEEELPLALQEARSLLNQGKKEYQSIKYEQALTNLLRARRQFILSLHLLRSNRDLIEAHLYLGMTFAVLQEQAKASEEFKRVVYLDPKREISGKEFPPAVLQAFAKARQDVMSAETVRFEVNSTPSGADVYLNGKLSGQTPLKIPLHAGEYFVLVDKPGLKPWFQTVPVQKAKELVEVNLESGGELSKHAQAFRVREGEDQSSEDLGFLFELANGVKTDFVVLATLQKFSDYRLLGQLLDAKTGRFSQVALVKVGQTLGSFDEAANDISAALLGFIGPDGQLIGDSRPDLNVPEDQLNVGAGKPQETTVMRPTKPWYKKWWVYPLILGAGAGVYIGAKGLGGQSGSKVIFNNRGN